jgi:hypothetical protein
MPWDTTGGQALESRGDTGVGAQAVTVTVTATVKNTQLQQAKVLEISVPR